VVGVDEVGRARAGPLSVGAAVVPADRRIYKIRDSKMLTEREREAMFDRIAEWCVTWAVGHASQAECDELGMSAAQKLAVCHRPADGRARPGADRRQSSVGSGNRRIVKRATPRACRSPPPRSWPRSPVTG
jgi:ribonuclease HII